MNSAKLPEVIYKALLALAADLGRIGRLILRAVVEFARDIALAVWSLLVIVGQGIVDFCRWLRTLTVRTYNGLVALVAVSLYIVLVLLLLWAPFAAYLVWRHSWYLYGGIGAAGFYTVALAVRLPQFLREDREPFKPHIALLVVSHVLIVTGSVGSAVYQYGVPLWQTYIAPLWQARTSESSTGTESESWQTVRVGRYHTDLPLRFSPQGFTSEEWELVGYARENVDEPQISEILLPRQFRSTVLVFEDTRPFSVVAHRGEGTMSFEVIKVNGMYRAIGWRSSEILVDATVKILDADGRQRTLTFAWYQ